jgi:hypothetical protein
MKIGVARIGDAPLQQGEALTNLAAALRAPLAPRQCPLCNP